MEKILVSWECETQDYKAGTSEVNTSGPNYSYHKHFFEADNYDKHLIFCKAIEPNSDLSVNKLVEKLKADFPNHEVEVRYANVQDAHNLPELKPKVEKILLEHRRCQVDILTNADNAVMKMTWYVAQAELEIESQLIELKEIDGKIDRMMLEAEKVDVGSQALHINERIHPGLFDDDYCYTPAIEPIYRKAHYRVAPAENVTVFISGETGTGKEHLAHYIHENSPRRAKNFESVSCAAMSDEELHVRLFGSDEKDGAFARCDGGTLLLDEVGDISMYMQQTLRKAIQRNKDGYMVIHPLGGEPKTVDVRIIASSNKDLYDLCQKGKYRWDLFYRLMVSELHIPALRERGAKDLKTLFEYLLKKVGQEHGVKPLNYKSEVWNHLKNYTFPGNVRELLGIVQRFYVEVDADEWISLSDFPPHFRRQVTVESTQYEVETIEDMEKIHIDKIMRKYKGKSTYVAKALGIQPATLYNKMRKYNLVRSDYTVKK